MKVLIYGLPGSGKSYLAEKLCEYLGDKVKWINADKVREEANDWDFSEEGRQRQKHRMKMLCEQAEAEGKIALADFSLIPLLSLFLFVANKSSPTI